MKEYHILEFAGMDFPFWVSKSMHIESYPAHRHDFIELEIVTGGSADHIVEGRTYQISRGDVFVVMPTYTHELRNVNELEIYNFKFDLDKLILLDTEIEKSAGFQALFILHPFDKYQHDFTSYMKLGQEAFEAAAMLSDLILKEWERKGPGYRLNIKSCLLALVTFLSSNYSPVISHTSPKWQDLLTTVNYIHENFTDKITLSGLAEMSCISERQYSRIFREVYGVSPIDYVIGCRLSLACRLLKNSRQSMMQISARCGFGDKVSFSRLFKSRYGVSPGKYRNLWKGGAYAASESEIL